MIVTFNAAGYMKKYFPEEEYPIDIMKKDATLADFFNELGNTKGAELPKAAWNKEKSRFRAPIMISIDGKVIKEETHPLYEGQHIAISFIISGG